MNNLLHYQSVCTLCIHKFYVLHTQWSQFDSLIFTKVTLNLLIQELLIHFFLKLSLVFKCNNTHWHGAFSSVLYHSVIQQAISCHTQAEAQHKLFAWRISAQIACLILMSSRRKVTYSKLTGVLVFPLPATRRADFQASDADLPGRPETRTHASQADPGSLTVLLSAGKSQHPLISSLWFWRGAWPNTQSRPLLR